MVLGLTGGIGSGKSMVARLFELLGCAVFNSDQAAKEIYFDAQVKLQVIKLLGSQSYLSDSSIDKAYISSRIFNDASLLKQLNAILHPAVGDQFRQFAQANKHKLVVKETALLFEAGLFDQVDKIAVVAANDELRLQRVMLRDGMSREEVVKRMNSQLPQEEKIKQAHFVIYNNEEQFLIPQVIAIFNQLKGQ